MRLRFICGLALLIGLTTTGEILAAGFKVYGYKTLNKKEIELVYLNNYIVESDLDQSFFGKSVDRTGHLSHSFEVEYGISSHLTVAAYLDFEQPQHEAFKYTRMRGVFFRYRFAEKGKQFFDTALYLEYYLPRKSYKNEEELEIRVILEKDIGPFRLDLNPIFEKATSGPEVEEGLKFNYGSGFYWHFSPKVRAGLEFYGKVGELSKSRDWQEQQHWIFPAFKIKLFNKIGLDTGIGFGLTDASDDLVLKNIVSIEF